jgi:hypothetical protein
MNAKETGSWCRRRDKYAYIWDLVTAALLAVGDADFFPLHKLSLAFLDHVKIIVFNLER